METTKTEKPQNRLDRALDNRQVMQRPTSWRAPESLPSPDDRPGWAHRWIRISIWVVVIHQIFHLSYVRDMNPVKQKIIQNS
jgi:hypothetical protein